eukprot:c19799_g1_i3.p2 GENE.c19799_g1_i3~~c19799_g1_i3.p2  ORF type:complete len:248 (+),score=36.48 c19799_g1_i3:792-1535(+)
MAAKYYGRPSMLSVGLLEGTWTRHARRSTELVLISQLINLVVAPLASQLALHNRCVGVITERFWQPCQNATAFTIDVTFRSDELSQDFEVPILRHDEVCTSEFDSELCQREVVASISKLSVSRVIYQTVFVLFRALLVLLFSQPRPPHHKPGRFEALLRRATKPTEQELTRSIVFLVILGIATGGVVPLIWPAVLFGIYSTMLLWRCSGRPATNRTRLVGRRVVWVGVATQVGFSIWFILANSSRDR